MFDKMTIEEKKKALKTQFGLSEKEAENQLEDMGEMSYDQRKTKPKNEGVK